MTKGTVIFMVQCCYSIIIYSQLVTHVRVLLQHRVIHYCYLLSKYVHIFYVLILLYLINAWHNIK